MNDEHRRMLRLWHEGLDTVDITRMLNLALRAEGVTRGLWSEALVQRVLNRLREQERRERAS